MVSGNVFLTFVCRLFESPMDSSRTSNCTFFLEFRLNVSFFLLNIEISICKIQFCKIFERIVPFFEETRRNILQSLLNIKPIVTCYHDHFFVRGPKVRNSCDPLKNLLFLGMDQKKFGGRRCR